jgi:alginate O-acetyltransferase complex protein AlgI
MGLLAYTFQIYFDFWGYSLMAIGLGRMLGFELPKNFDYPYLSTSMTEFWRRWHMTLGSWFREYVYIPLGGNRGSKIKVFRNLLIVWLLTGIWHGAGWNFVLWGLLLFGLIAIEKAGLKQWLDKYRILGHIYMAAVIPLSWAVFAHPNWQQLALFFKRLFGQAAGNVYALDYIKYGMEYGAYLLLCLLFTTRIPQKVWAKIKDSYAGITILAVIFVGVVYCLYIGLDNPFLYYQF